MDRTATKQELLETAAPGIYRVVHRDQCTGAEHPVVEFRNEYSIPLDEFIAGLYERLAVVDVPGRELPLGSDSVKTVTGSVSRSVIFQWSLLASQKAVA